MNTEELSEHTDYLFRVAIGKCDSLEEAQDLVQSTLLEGLLAIRKGTIIESAKSWLSTVLNRKYYDLLREKYRKPLTFYGMDYDIPYEEGYSPETPDDMELSEEENLRRLVARQTYVYREVLVRHYFHGQSIETIANALSIPENTVKSRLRLGREKLRKDLTMEKYEKQSYEPEVLWISSSGNGGMNGEPYSLVRNDKITMNLLILAYDKPVTIPELADAIGISTTYVEPIVDRLVDGELMKRIGDKVFTDFIIYTEADMVNMFDVQKSLANTLCRDIWRYLEEGLGNLRCTEYYQRQNPSQAAKLEGYFVLHSTYHSVIKVRDEVAGFWPYSEYPYRKDGGRWFAMGNRHTADYEYDKSPYKGYDISGEAGGSIDRLPGASRVGLFDYDTDALGRSHTAYHYEENFDNAREGMIKFLYAIHTGNENILSGIPGKLLENMDTYLKLDLVERLPDGKLKLNVPVLSNVERKAFYDLMEEYTEKLSRAFHDEYLTMIKNPVTVPKQLQKDVPGFLRYLHTCGFFPSALIYEAKSRGLFLKDYAKPAPPVIMVVTKEEA
ncbi:MAG: RNA polymerase sigma factor [Acetatifactor sp.]|nr:RNA polymerase sigma factor [Acetatifactor sp.]